MKIGISIGGRPFIEIEGTAGKPQADAIYNNCAFGTPYPVILNGVKPLNGPAVENHTAPKKVETDEDFDRWVKFVSDKTGYDYSQVKWTLKTAEEYFG